MERICKNYIENRQNSMDMDMDIVIYGERLYKLYTSLMELEVKGLKDSQQYSEVVENIKIVREYEDKKYDSFDIEYIEQIINDINLKFYFKPSFSDISYTIDMIDKSPESIANDIIERRILDRLWIEYYKKKNYNQSFMVMNQPEISFGYGECIYCFGKKKYVYDRTGIVEQLRKCANSSINQMYLEGLEKSEEAKHNASALVKNKYYLIFIDKFTEDSFLYDKKIQIQNKSNKEVYDYLIYGISNCVFFDIIQSLKQFEDCDLIKENRLTFLLNLIYLKIAAKSADIGIVSDNYFALDPTKNISKIIQDAIGDVVKVRYPDVKAKIKSTKRN